MTPTSTWLATVADILPALDGPSGTAERLLLLLHYGIDWENGWIAQYRATYWERHLPDHVFIAAHMASTLRAWWQIVSGDMQSTPRTRDERIELAELLNQPPEPVLRALRDENAALVLRTRIVAETRRFARLAG